MKRILAPVILLIISAISAAIGQEISFRRLQGPPNSITEKFFELGVIPTVKVKSKLIQKVILEVEEGKSHARVGVFYKNTTSKALSPNYTLRFYNPYGILMGGIRVPEDPAIPEGLIESESEVTKAFHPKITRLDALFRYTDVKEYPKDFFKIRWISISDTNP